MRRIFLHAILLLFILFPLNSQFHKVWAQAGSAQDLIAAVNAVRASHDLAPYISDGGLMAFAQAHSEYMASIGKITHSRADGSQPADHGVFENIGGGPNASVSNLVDRQWTDYWHQHTMIGFSEGYIGAGVATGNGVVYYTLVVRRTGGFTYIQPTAAPAGNTPVPGQAPSGDLIALATVTPASDGAVVHRVGPGETLWTIAEAYSISIEELAELNGLSVSNPVIYAGRDLIIRAAHTPTPTATVTGTPEPTPTATATRRPTRTPRLTITPAPASLTDQVSDFSMDNRSIAIGVTLVVGVSLLLLVTFGMKDKK
jgi:LysM repeat protein